MASLSAEIEILAAHESTAAKDRGIVEDTPVLVSGSGATLRDSRGRAYIDFLSGSGVTNAGHGNKAIAEAVKRQLDAGLLQTGPLLVSKQKADLIKKLVSVAPPELSRVHLTVTGGEGVEAALKAARSHTGKHNVIAFWGGYHGRTMGALGLTSHRSYRSPFLPVTVGTAHFPFPFAYRNPFGLDDQAPRELSRTVLTLLDNALSDPASGLSPTAAIIVEPIQAVGGIVVPPPEFLPGLRQICDRHGVVLIADEIFCGFGRTGEWFGCQRDGVVPDLMVVSKGLAGGFPISALLGREEILGKLPGNIQSTTFEGNPLACAAAVASIDYLQSVDAPALARSIAATVERWRSETNTDLIGEFRGAGALWGLDIVKPGTREPAAAIAKKIQQEALRRGLILYLGGRHGNVVGIVPPLVATSDELNGGLAVLKEAIQVVA